MDHSQIQWAEILVEGHVGEVIINVEEESVGNVDRGFLIGDPVKFIYKKEEQETRKFSKDGIFLIILKGSKIDAQ
jgi:hypothetical protein